MSDASQKRVGSRIRALRRQADMKQEALAAAINIEPNSLSRLESGKHFPSLDTLENIAGVLNVQLKDFFDFPDQRESVMEMRGYLEGLAQTLDAEKLAKVVAAARKTLRSA